MSPDLDAWNPWTPWVIADRLAGLDVPWYVAAGWAIDLFRGEQTREHEDVEIAVPADRFDDVAARFPDCDFYVAGGGTVVPLSMDALPTHHQTWAWQRSAGVWRFDVFREPYDGATWICRRNRQIRRPYAEIIRYSADGIPYLCPEVVLLFKAKSDRDKDRIDFEGTVPLLSSDERRWLKDALDVVHPQHPWLARLR
ncbi:nucleotidyltransferase domain-containing protein [Polymorphospora rubra]|uniref:nucleotidyltransferase domain-containing protein n=1 Tax=Polymorphospora rubra TaxID=338584 RepID=UPI0033FCF2E6